MIQETNSFNPYMTDLDHFRKGYILEGDMLRNLKGTNSEISGFYEVLAGDDTKVVPISALWAVPYGPVRESAFSKILFDFRSAVHKNLPCDGILLALHGSMVSEETEDCEGALLQALRELVGTDVPIVCTLDYHANITDKMIKNADVMTGYMTYPHIDFSDTGKRAACIMKKLIRDPERPYVYSKRLPLILPVENTQTTDGLMKPVIDRLRENEKNHSVLSNSVFCPQPWIDVYANNVSILAYLHGSSGNEALIEEYDRSIKYIWDKRAEFFISYPRITEVLERYDLYSKPLILVDSGDVVSAGGIGDSTKILSGLISVGSGHQSVVGIIDKNTVDKAYMLGEGNSGNFSIGGEQDFDYNRKVSIEAHILRLSAEKVRIEGPALSGITLDFGRRALLRHKNIHILCCENISYTHDPTFYESMGLDLSKIDIITVKSHKMFRPAYERFKGTTLILNTSGFTSHELKRFDYTRVKRPVFPLDEI